jgi:hypothetical protein
MIKVISTARVLSERRGQVIKAGAKIPKIFST